MQETFRRRVKLLHFFFFFEKGYLKEIPSSCSGNFACSSDKKGSHSQKSSPLFRMKSQVYSFRLLLRRDARNRVIPVIPFVIVWQMPLRYSQVLSSSLCIFCVIINSFASQKVPLRINCEVNLLKLLKTTNSFFRNLMIALKNKSNIKFNFEKVKIRFLKSFEKIQRGKDIRERNLNNIKIGL